MEKIITNAMSKKLTRKQKTFVKAYIETGNGRESARRAYNVKNDNVAGVVAGENLTKPNVKNAILEALPDDLLARVHQEGLEATFTDKYNTDEADYAVRHKYLDTAYKIKGSFAPEKSVTLNIEAQISPRIKELSAYLNQEDEA